MADGLLSNILNFIDQRKQASMAGLGLLASNPQEYLTGRAEQLRDFTRAQEAGLPAERSQLRGLLVSPEQQAAQQYANQQLQDVALGFAGNIKPTSGLLGNQFNILKRDASDIFGSGAEKIRYIDPKSGGSIEVLARPNYPASVVSLEVPEAFRGKKIGESLQAQVLQDFPAMQGQISSKAAAKTAYRLGRRPADNPNASLDDVFKAIDEYSSVNMVSPQVQKQTGLLGTEAAQQSPNIGYVGNIGTAPRKLPLSDMGELTKFTKPLPAGQLYRETSSSNLMDLFKGNTPFGSPITYFSEVPEMALGQGANKGVMFKVNSEGLKGRPFLGKPGLEQAYLQKAGEFEIKEQPNNIIKAINEVWVSPDAYKNLRKAEVMMFNRQLSDLEKSGVKVNKVDKLPNALD